MSVYIAPNQTIKIETLNKLLVSENLIIVGDFNAKNKLWGSPINDFRGKMMGNFIDEQNLVVINNGKGTRLNYNGTISHLDLILCTHNLSFKIEMSIINDLWGSDHYPLQIIYDDNITSQIQTKTKYDYNRANWDLFKYCLENDDNINNYNLSVEQSYKNLLLAFKKARDISIPIKKGEFKHKYSPFWTPECSKAKKEKKTRKRLLEKTKP